MSSLSPSGWPRFPRQFFHGQTLEIARNLLGGLLTTKLRGVETAGIIVETEAYLSSNDPASHSARGRTARNEVMFWDGGYCYVYFIYGVHFCVNVVTEPEGSGAAVLIRAILPVQGVETMRRRRRIRNDRLLTNGPGKLCQALGITRIMNGEDLLTSSRIMLSRYSVISEGDVMRTPRIGISQAADRPWRFVVSAAGRERLVESLRARNERNMVRTAGNLS